MLSQQHWTNDHPKKDFLWIKSGDSALEHCCWCRRRGKNRIENPETVGAGPIMNSRRHFQKHELEAAGQAHLSLVICHMSLSALVSLGERNIHHQIAISKYKHLLVTKSNIWRKKSNIWSVKALDTLFNDSRRRSCRHQRRGKAPY